MDPILYSDNVGSTHRHVSDVHPMARHQEPARFRHGHVQHQMGLPETTPSWIKEFTEWPRWLRFSPHFGFTSADGQAQRIDIPRHRTLALGVEAENRMVRALASDEADRRYGQAGRPAGAVNVGDAVVNFKWTDEVGEGAPVELNVRLELNDGELHRCTMTHAQPGEAQTIESSERFYPMRIGLAQDPGVPLGNGLAPFADLPAELWHMIGAYLPDIGKLGDLASTCRDVLVALNPTFDALNELDIVRGQVTAELLRLRREPTRRDATALSAPQLERIANAFAAPISPSYERMHRAAIDEIVTTLYNWADQIPGYHALDGYRPRRALQTMLQHAAHLPHDLLRMAAPRLALGAASLRGMDVTPLDLAQFTDLLMSLDATPRDPQAPTAEQLARQLGTAQGRDARNQALIDAYMADAARRPPAFEAAALAALAALVPQVGIREDEYLEGRDRPPNTRLDELMLRLDQRRTSLPGDAAEPLRIRMRAVIRYLQPDLQPAWQARLAPPPTA